MAVEYKPHYRDFFIFILFLTAVIIGTVILFSKNSSETQMSTKPTPQATSQAAAGKYSAPPKMQIDSKKTYTAQMNTNYGAIEINLYAKETPVTVNNFVFLAKESFYNGTIFHRIIKDFMIQGGDPQGTGRGGPGYKFDDEKITRDYKRGIIAMANSGPNTNGSQFFIMHKDNNLPKNYVIFGEVVKGLDVVDKIAEVPIEDNGIGEKSKPTKEVKIEKITIQEK